MKKPFPTKANKNKVNFGIAASKMELFMTIVQAGSGELLSQGVSPYKVQPF